MFVYSTNAAKPHSFGDNDLKNLFLFVALQQLIVNIHIPQFSEHDISQFQDAQVWKKLAALKVKKSSREGDVPGQIVRLFAAYLAEPLTNIVNCAIRTGEYPYIWKQEMATPIPKTHPTSKITDLRNISGLLIFNKVAESLIADLVLSDIQNNIEKSQYGNTKGKSINHYLINMINRILTAVDQNTKKRLLL